MKPYIKDNMSVKEADIINETEKFSGTVYAMYTDRLTCGEKITDSSLLLEVRIFDEDFEAKFSRADINSDFLCRVIDDNHFRKILSESEVNFENTFENRILDDCQYLDINSELSSGCNIRTTGGGSYTLPFENADRILIRNYIDYSDNGIAEITDFRIVKMIKKGEQ